MSSLPILTFGTLLRRYRLAAGLSQEALAEQAHLSREAISTLERGSRRAPRQETIDLLADALRLSPAERSHLYAAARGQPLSNSRSDLQRGSGRQPSAHLPLVGRQPELALLERHLAGEEPPLLVLTGEPGIGKTRLLREASHRASKEGWTVLEGSCHRRSGQEPYTPLLGALEEYLRRTSRASLRVQLEGCAWLVRLLPELAETTLVPSPSWSLPPEQERRLLFAAVSRFLANVAGPAGTILLLDDLQWAGADALDLLATLLRVPAHLPMRVICAYRTTEARPTDVLSGLLADLAVAGLATQHQLFPLAPQEAAELLDTLLEGAEDENVERREQILTRTGGVPFFLVSCAQVLRTSASEMEKGKVPWNVAESIRQRVAALSPSAQEVLAAAAIMGRSPPDRLLRQVAGAMGLSQQETIAAVEHLNQARLLVEAEKGNYQFPHDLIREVVQDNISWARRTTLHQQIAEALEQEPGVAPIEQLAYHYGRAGNREKAGIYLERAGDHAQALHALAEAEGYYREALVSLDQEGRVLDAARARVSLGTVLRFLGRYQEALEVLDHAFRTYQRVEDTEGLSHAALEISQVHLHRRTAHQGLVWLEPVVARLHQRGSSPGLARLYFCLAALHGVLGDYSQELEAIEQAKVCAPDLYTSADEGGWWREEHAATLFMVGRLEEATHILEEFLADTSERPRIEALQTLAAIALNWGDFEQERQYLEQGLALAEHIGDQPSAIFVRHRLGRNAFFRGDWTQARRDLEESLRQSEELAAANKVRPGPFEIARGDFFHFGVGLLRLAQGERDVATRFLEAELAHAARQTIRPMALRWTQMMLAERDLLEGHPEEARARLEPLLDRAGYPETDVTRFLPILAWAYLDLGDEQRAESTVQQALARASQQHMRPTLTDALRVQALLGIRRQRWEEARAALEEALALCRAMPYPWAEAKALYVYGLLHQAKDEPELACERLEAALAILARLGERLYAQRVEQALARDA